jgi:hypothetical protein
VNALSRIALVGVFAEVFALCDVEGVGGDDLVEGVGRAGERFAGIAVATNMLTSIAFLLVLLPRMNMSA